MAGGYKHQPQGMDAFAAQLNDLQRQINELRNAAPIRNSVISTDGSLRSGDFDGSGLTDPGTDGWWLGQGGMVVNSIVLRDQIIGNDALTSPVLPDWVLAVNNGFSLNTTMTNKISVSKTVPAGCTRLAALVVGRVYAINTTGSLDFLFAQQNIGGSASTGLPLAVSAGGSGINVAPYAVVMINLVPGSTVLFELDAGTNTGTWAFNGANTAEMSGVLMWFR